MLKTYKDARKLPPILFPVTIGRYMCPDSESIKKVMVTLNKMQLQPFPLIRPYDPYGRIQKIIVKSIHRRYLDFWANCEDEAEARRRRYQRLTLNQIKTFDNIPIPQQLKKDDGRIITDEYEEKKIYNDTISTPILTIQEDISLDPFIARTLQLTQAWVDEQIEALKKKGVAITVDNKKKEQDILDEEYDDFINEKRKSKGDRLPPQQQQSKRPPRGKKIDNEPKGVIIERAVFMAEEAATSGSGSGSASPPQTRKQKSKKGKIAEAKLTKTQEEGQSSRKPNEEDILMEEEPKEEEAPLLFKRKRRAP